MHIIILNGDNPSDLVIAKLAQQFLVWTTVLPLESITISVLNGWVTLSGSVSWISQKRAATQALQSISGVTGITDHVDICNSKGHSCPS